MSITLEELVTGIHASLHSYTGVQEQVTWLENSCTDSETSLTIGSTDNMHRGIVEIEDELIYVSSSSDNVLTLPPFGRGYRGSTAAAHAADVQVTFDPSFPRVEIKRAIKQTIEGLYPMLYQVKATDLTSVGVIVGYELPADCDGVLGVWGQYPGDPDDYWTPIERWSFDTNSPDYEGNVLNLYGLYSPGIEIRVVYKAKFGELTTDLETAGLPESFADLITYAVTARMIRFLEPARLQNTSVENLSRAAVVGAGEAAKTANQLYAMYQQRLVEERRKLLELTPSTPNFLPR